MAGLNNEVCLFYQDDIIVYSRGLDEHQRRLQALFERLRWANLELKPSTCWLLQRQVEFLGHVVSADVISTDSSKIEVVSSWPKPNCIREVRAFLGLCYYYRRFVKGFVEIAAPLHALTRKGEQFVWDDLCQRALEALKGALTSSSILAMPTDEGRFLLDTDASSHGIGAVLSQEQDGQERVVAFASLLYSQHEARYCVTRQELLVVVFYLKHFKQYLLGRRFTIRTDHAALRWLRNTPQAIGQQARWLERIEEYDFDFQHRPGTRHGNANAMSGRPCRRLGCCIREMGDVQNDGMQSEAVK
jgi:hypothetical protein